MAGIPPGSSGAEGRLLENSGRRLGMTGPHLCQVESPAAADASRGGRHASSAACLGVWVPNPSPGGHDVAIRKKPKAAKAGGLAASRVTVNDKGRCYAGPGQVEVRKTSGSSGSGCGQSPLRTAGSGAWPRTVGGGGGDGLGAGRRLSSGGEESVRETGPEESAAVTQVAGRSGTWCARASSGRPSRAREDPCGQPDGAAGVRWPIVRPPRRCMPAWSGASAITDGEPGPDAVVADGTVSADLVRKNPRPMPGIRGSGCSATEHHVSVSGLRLRCAGRAAFEQRRRLASILLVVEWAPPPPAMPPSQSVAGFDPRGPAAV